MEIRSIQEFSNIVNENIIEGYAVVFNRESEILYDKKTKKFFTEIIESSAITDELIRSCDIKMLINHNKERMLARSRYGEGTLRLTVDDYGVKFSFQIPDTSDGQYIREMVNRKDFNGCSFSFVDEDVVLDWNRERGCATRKVKKVRALFDCSIVADPAYSDTEVSVRQIEDLEKIQIHISTEVEKNDSWKEELNNYRQRMKEK